MQKISLVLALLGSCAATSAFAVDATLNFKGNIIAASCTVTSSTANQTITLDTATVSDFTDVGTTKNPKSFKLDLTNCSSNAKVKMTVSGTMDTVASVLKNTGTAAQVGIQLLQASAVDGTTGTPLTLNSAIDRGVVDATNAMTIPMVAQYYRLGAMTAGTVAAVATVNFTYN